MKPTDSPVRADADKAANEAFRFVVLDEHFAERNLSLPDPKPNGRQIAEEAGHRPADDTIILQQLRDGSLEELRLEELTDLKEAGIERFFVMEGDRTFRLMIDGLRIEWPREKVTGETIRKLARRDESFDVYQDFDDAPDLHIDEDDTVSLGGKGLERFKTMPAKKLVTVYYNEDQKFELARRAYTTEELREIFAVPAGYILQLVTKDCDFVELKPHGKLAIREGMKFLSHAPSGQSS